MTSNRPRRRILRWYILGGPLFGALLMTVGFILFIVLPDLIHDPDNQFGHDRWGEFGGAIALILMFAYPVGLLPATAAGLCHRYLRGRLGQARPRLIGLVCAAGAVGSVLQAAVFGHLPRLELLVAITTAAILAFWLSRTDHNLNCQGSP
ncbi:hypothetical protein [Nitrogeniibacter aestuarii]|uniref:hypothetical protein n=1 Tax=Nitrogeniibacter aestuarii TaxID=2815343 RepID=UPI001D1229F1|nr:hypothetical protein [Nitrogeniibacter aestuarii]